MRNSIKLNPYARSLRLIEPLIIFSFPLIYMFVIVHEVAWNKETKKKLLNVHGKINRYDALGVVEKKGQVSL